MLAIHVGVSRLTGNDFWLLDDSEASAISDSGVAMMKHLNIQATQKGIDILTFVAAVGSAYVPRAILQANAMKETAAARRAGIVFPAKAWEPPPGNLPPDPATPLDIGIGGIVTGDPDNPTPVH